MKWFERKEILAVLILVILVGVNGAVGFFSKHALFQPDTSAKPKAATTVSSDVKGSAKTTGDSDAADEASTGTVTVHVDGAVKSPGVYVLPSGSRVNDAVQKAGGISAKADTLSVNLAEKIQDGQQIIVYEKGMADSGATSTRASGSSARSSAAAGTKATSQGPISLNHGTAAELMNLPGIGEKTAEKIIAYRKAQGGFKSLEELKNVSGIGPKKFDKIKSQIRL